MTHDGTELVLVHGGGAWQIRVDGREVMDSRHFRTEEALAELALARILPRPAPSVLVGGLGMGFTLRAALDRLRGDALVTAVEVFEAIVAWNSGPLADAAGHPLADDRVTLVRGDVLDVLARSERGFDAVLLDVDNGPHDLVRPANRVLYNDAGARLVRQALRSGGTAAYWSARPAAGLVAALRRAGLAVRTETVLPDPSLPAVEHTVVLALRDAA